MRASVDLPPPPPLDVADDRGGGWGTEWVELVTARDDIDAHLLSGRLELIGIETRKVEHRAAPAWLFGGANPWAPVTVLVRRFQLDDARLVLAEVSFQAPAEEPSLQHGSERRKLSPVWWLTAVVVGAAIVFTIFMQVFEHTTGCQLPFFCQRTPASEQP